MPIGPKLTTAGRSGNVPQVNITGYHREVQKRLFYSRREQALILEKTVRGGFFELEMGQVMTGVHGDEYVIAPLGENGRAYLSAQANSGQKEIQIPLSQAAPFFEDDHITIDGEGITAENHEIDDISVSGDTVTITTKANLTSTFTLAAGSFITLRQGGNYYVMDQEIDTGHEAKKEGAWTSVVVGNAVIYQDAVIGWNSTVATELNAHEDGVFYVIK